MRFTFTGSNASGYIEMGYRGEYRFVTGEPVDVADEDLCRRLLTNPEFERESAGNLEDLNKKRAHYRKLAGKPGGPRWDEATYDKKIAELEAK